MFRSTRFRRIGLVVGVIGLVVCVWIMCGTTFPKFVLAFLGALASLVVIHWSSVAPPDGASSTRGNSAEGT